MSYTCKVELPFNPHAPVDMPETAWSDWAELREQYTDCNRHKTYDDIDNFVCVLKNYLRRFCKKRYAM